MKITILIDNTPHPEHPDILFEHGLSFYFEVDGYKCLIDSGASGKFIENAKILGINLADVDFVVLSHGHADHTGGLDDFLQINSKAKIYLSAHISEDTLYYSIRRGSKRNISIDFSLLKTNSDRFVFIEKNCSLTENVSLICEIPSFCSQPKGNQTLLANDSLDDFKHEMALTVNSPKGTIIFSSCCHRGILNTLKACDKSKIVAFVGGTHLIDSDEHFQFETTQEIQTLAETIHDEFSGMKLITGHCTGQNVVSVFKEIMKSDFQLFYSGEIIDV